MEFDITVMPGDGIGPEIVREAKKVLDKVGSTYGHVFNYTEVKIGGISIDTYGVPLTDEAIETAKSSDAVLLGAVGGIVGKDKWYELSPDKRPEAGLLKIRKSLGLYANLRPAYLYEELKEACPLKEEIAAALEIPKKTDMGDFAFPCFKLAKVFRKAPNMIAEELTAQIAESRADIQILKDDKEQAIREKSIH